MAYIPFLGELARANRNFFVLAVWGKRYIRKGISRIALQPSSDGLLVDWPRCFQRARSIDLWLARPPARALVRLLPISGSSLPPARAGCTLVYLGARLYCVGVSIYIAVGTWSSIRGGWKHQRELARILILNGDGLINLHGAAVRPK